jgi:hypothetical protein
MVYLSAVPAQLHAESSNSRDLALIAPDTRVAGSECSRSDHHVSCSDPLPTDSSCTRVESEEMRVRQ